MTSYILRRLLAMIFILLGVAVVTFLLVWLTGDPVALIVPMNATPEDVAQLRHAYGFDRPFLVQLGDFLLGLLQGDFGQSIRHQQPAFALVVERLPATIELAIAGILLAVLVAIPLAVVAASRRNSWVDGVASGVGLLGQSMPTFWLGILLIMLFAVRWRFLPSSGNREWSSLVLPAVTIGFYSMATILRLARSAMVDVLAQDYVRTARAKGVSERRVVYRHALRNALLPVITVIGLQFGNLLGGAVITESVFSWPGMGQFILKGIADRDMPIVQAGVFVFALFIVTVNLLTDLAYAWVDPRVRYD